MSVSIRPAKPTDEAVLIDLLERSWRTTWAPNLPRSAGDRFDRDRPVVRYVTAFLSAFEVAVIDGLVVGLLHRDRDHVVSLEVDLWFQGQGIGSALMDHAERHGARRLEVRAFNTKAIRFYERRGWQPVSRFLDTELGAPVETIAYERCGAMSAQCGAVEMRDA